MFRFFIILTIFLHSSFAGDITSQIKFDPKCVGGQLVTLRIQDCVKFPCTMQRGKDYNIDGEFIVDKELANPILRCGTVYLGRQHNLPGYGGCDTITNGTCPLQGGVAYTTATVINVPYYVPPINYVIACRLEDDAGVGLFCGSGSGRVV